MNKKDYIQKLEVFKNLILKWRELDYDSPEVPIVRSEINKTKSFVERIVDRTGASKRINVAPPPAVGGFIMRGINPFDVIFNPPYGMGVTGIIIDSIDEAIGAVESSNNFSLETVETSTKQVDTIRSKGEIFLVHGHDNELKESVARFLEKIDITPIILHEQANSGLTIIEKFEKFSNVSYAIVLMSPDDVGALKTESHNLKNRARQNVIFELGYFFGKLGRKNVCALLKGDIERPSDYDGIIYIGIDPSNGWKLLVAKELKEAGLEFDMNKIF